MSVYQKNNGRWVAEVATPNGRKVRRTVDSRKEALAAEKRMKAEVILGRGDSTNYTVANLLNDAKVIWSGNKNEANSIRQFTIVCDILGLKTDIRTIRTASLDKVVDKLRERDLGDSTIHHYLAVISAALRWAWKRDLIEGMPHVPWTALGKPRDHVITHEQEEKMLAFLTETTPAIATIYEVLFATGARINEVLLINERDVHKDYLMFRDTKNGEDRSVPLDADLAKELKELVVNRRVPTYRKVWLAAERAQKVLNLPFQPNPHTVRHTVATRMAAADVNMKVLGDVLGHRSIHTSAKYVHSHKEAMRNAIAKTRKEK